MANWVVKQGTESQIQFNLADQDKLIMHKIDQIQNNKRAEENTLRNREKRLGRAITSTRRARGRVAAHSG